MEFFFAIAAGIVVGILTGRSKSLLLPLLICVAWVTIPLVVLTHWNSPSFTGTDASSIVYALLCGYTVFAFCFLVTYFNGDN